MIRQQKMAQLHTPAEAAEILRIRESWLRAKAAARAIPCTFIGKHLRFSDDDIAQIMAEGARQPVTRGRGTRRQQPARPGDPVPGPQARGRSTRR
jgi:excisionase family DNA binding protein